MISQTRNIKKSEKDMHNLEMAKYVLTGGPSTGKTTLIKKISEHGFLTIEEQAAKIILEEIAKEKADPDYTAIVPWKRFREFQDIVIANQIESEKRCNYKINFLDRSLVDNLAYAELQGVDLGETYQQIKEANYTRIFFIERINQYENNHYRKEDEDYAIKVHEKIYELYDRLGYDIIKVPAMNIGTEGIKTKEESVQKRLEFILNNIDIPKNREIEAKFKVKDHFSIKHALKDYLVEDHGYKVITDQILDFGNLFERRGLMLRLRDENGLKKITLKGPNRGIDFNDRFEFEKEVSEAVRWILKFLFKEKTGYIKFRQTYVPFGDPNCNICLDYLPKLGYFVEIEAKSENQVRLWKERLGITSDSIRDPYYKLIQNKGFN